MKKNLGLFTKYKIFHRIKNFNASKIYYIDECNISCSVTRSTLTSMGYLVQTESNITNVLINITFFIPDIIIIDINDKYDSIDLLNKIQTKFGERNIIFIGVINNIGNYDLYNLSFYFDHLIVKPIVKESFDFLIIGDNYKGSLKKVNKKKLLNKIHYSYNDKLEKNTNLYKTTLNKILYSNNLDMKCQDWIKSIKKKKLVSF